MDVIVLELGRYIKSQFYQDFVTNQNLLLVTRSFPHHLVSPKHLNVFSGPSIHGPIVLIRIGPSFVMYYPVDLNVSTGSWSRDPCPKIRSKMNRNIQNRVDIIWNIRMIHQKTFCGVTNAEMPIVFSQRNSNR